MERGFLKSKETSAEKDPCTLCTANWKDSIRWGGGGWHGREVQLVLWLLDHLQVTCKRWEGAKQKHNCDIMEVWISHWSTLSGKNRQSPALFLGRHYDTSFFREMRVSGINSRAEDPLKCLEKAFFQFRLSNFIFLFLQIYRGML